MWKLYSNCAFICGSCSDTIRSKQKKKLSCSEIIVPINIDWVLRTHIYLLKSIENTFPIFRIRCERIFSYFAHVWLATRILNWKIWFVLKSSRLTKIIFTANRMYAVMKLNHSRHSRRMDIRKQLTDSLCLLRRIWFIFSCWTEGIIYNILANYRNRPWKSQHVMMGARKCCSPLHFLRHTKSAFNKFGTQRR